MAHLRMTKDIRQNNPMMNVYHPNFQVDYYLLVKIAILTTYWKFKAVCLPCRRIIPQTLLAKQWCLRMLFSPLPSVSLVSWRHRQAQYLHTFPPWPTWSESLKLCAEQSVIAAFQVTPGAEKKKLSIQRYRQDWPWTFPQTSTTLHACTTLKAFPETFWSAWS